MEHIQVIVSIIGGLLMILLFIIGFFLRQLYFVVQELTVSVNSLSKIVAVLENKNTNMALGCNSKHLLIDSRLARHGVRLDEVDKDIVRIQEQIRRDEKNN